MENADLFLSLFKVYTNYLEVYKLNKNCENTKTMKQRPKRRNADPLSCEIQQRMTTTWLLPKTKPLKPPKGLKRKYLSEPEPKKCAKVPKTEVGEPSILETGNGVTEDELKRKGIKKKKSEKRQVRRWWVRDEYTDRDKSGYFVSTYTKMKTTNPTEFFDLTRMELPIYEMLLDLLRDDLTKQSIRTPIDCECRLAVTLTYLSQSTPFFQLATTFQMGKSTIREIIYDTCKIIWKILSPGYVKKLNSNDYQKIADDFMQKTALPNCIGVFDSQVLNVSMPQRRSEAQKGLDVKYISVDMTCDTNYLITWADIRPLDNQESLEIFDSNLTDIPVDKPLPGGLVNFPYYFVGDVLFPLKEHVMRPYTARALDDPKKTVFNRYMSTARNLIENTFGILAARWTILQTEFKCYPENAKKVILAIIALHNFIMKNSNIEGVQNRYCPHNFIDWVDEFGNVHQGEWRKEFRRQKHLHGRVGSNNATRNAILLRDMLADYFFANESFITI